MPRVLNPEQKMPKVSAVILAAGASRRMGKPKMLLPWGESTVIGAVITTLERGGVFEPVIVSGRSADDLQSALQTSSLRWAHNPDYETTEMLQSLQIGMQNLPSAAEAFLVVLGDQPQIEETTVRLLIERFQEKPEGILIPSYRHRRGHPWLVRKDLWGELLALPETDSLRQFLNRHAQDIVYLEVDTPSVLMDLDTPEQYKQARPSAPNPASPNIIYAWRLDLRDDEYQVTVHDVPAQLHSLDAVSKMLPGGAYTTLRTYFRTKILRIEDHFTRLDESARRVGQTVSIQQTFLRAALRSILRQSPFPETRLRITLDLEDNPGRLYVSIEKLNVPSEQEYQQGVSVLTHTMKRDNPRAKLTRFIETAADYRSHLPAGINELLMVRDDGMILEGLSSNFFGVVSGKLHTMAEDVLPGITRATVLELIRQMQFPLEFHGVSITAVPTLEEGFLTSASRGILPVVKIDQQFIANGQPGKMTRLLIQAFSDWVMQQVKEA